MILHIIPEKPQDPHIADQVLQAAVQKHAGQDGPVDLSI